MSRLESASLPIIRPLLLGEPILLDLMGQYLLASTLALVSCRIELTAYGMKTIPQSERDILRTTLLPNANWRIWIARHTGADLKDYLYRYRAMQVELDAAARYGAEYCNTHVTTIVVGQLYAHIFFSSVWPDFPGYHGFNIVPIWPPTYNYIDTRTLPAMPDERGILLHEAIIRGMERLDQ